MDPDAEFDGSLGRQVGVAHDHAVLDLDCAPHLVDHTAKFDEEPVAGALDHAPMMRGGPNLGSINPWKRRGCQRAQMPVPPRSGVRIPSAPPGSPRTGSAATRRSAPAGSYWRCQRAARRRGYQCVRLTTEKHLDVRLDRTGAGRLARRRNGGHIDRCARSEGCQKQSAAVDCRPHAIACP
jgi:hypothetical protein